MEWIAEDKGYFAQAGLSDYELRAHTLLSKDTPKFEAIVDLDFLDNRQGAYQTYEEGRDAAISCACHWR